MSPGVSLQHDPGRLPLRDLVSTRTLSGKLTQWSSKNASASEVGRRVNFLGESASGHQILMDGNSGDKAPSPMEMVLMAAGGCSAIDVVSILQKGVRMWSIVK